MIDIKFSYSIVQKQILEYKLAERYCKDENILKSHINEKAFLNADSDYVYFISTLINSFYSTRMGADRLYQVCKFIETKKYIKSIEQVMMVINEAQNNGFTLNEKIFHSYSFLTKYYSIHNRYMLHNGEYSDYPIFDSAVENGIKRLIHLNYINFKIKDLKDYEQFYLCTTAILKKLNDEAGSKNRLTYSDLDRYFWSLR